MNKFLILSVLLGFMGFAGCGGSSEDKPEIVTYTCNLTVDGSAKTLTTQVPTSILGGKYSFWFSDGTYDIGLTLPSTVGTGTIYNSTNFQTISGLTFELTISGIGGGLYEATNGTGLSVTITSVTSNAISGTFTGTIKNSAGTVTKTVSGDFAIDII